MPPPIALTIAGSDSGGGAGIQADLKTFHQWGVFGTSVITAITAQNTTGVFAVHGVPDSVVEAQIDAVVSDLRPVATKTGMLGTASAVETVAAAWARHGLGNLVVDPVMVATSGDRLSDDSTLDAIRDRLLPHATLVTPNLPEASLLVGRPVESLDDARDAARRLIEMGAGAALIKGGHRDEAKVLDLFWDGSDEVLLEAEKAKTSETHGTGCSLAASIAAGLALGRELPVAVTDAVRWVQEGIRTAPGLGEGHGPINHWANQPA